ncbi:MAG: glycoside hydrolase family 16 protein, partial [Clostridia bacterium]|nr:glycoside hydrolase family 16 protein [Clostridia bacterium]
MKKLLQCSAIIMLLAVAIISLFGCSGKSNIEDALKEGNYELVFEDNFDGTEINRKVWRGLGEDGMIRRGAYYYNTEDVVFVKDGNAVIRTYFNKEDNAWRTSWLESSTYGKEDEGFSSKYGYFEARCIAPPCTGIWSAFWLMPDYPVSDKAFNNNGTTAKYGAEIDIMESAWYNSKTNDGKAQFVVHIDYNGINKYASKIKKVSKMHSEFHTYGVMWTPTDYTWYIDGRKVLQTKHIVNGVDLSTPAVNEYIIFSTEVGGSEVNGKPVVDEENWAGNPNLNDKSKKYDFIIDYVRVYK